MLPQKLHVSLYFLKDLKVIFWGDHWQILQSYFFGSIDHFSVT